MKPPTIASLRSTARSNQDLALHHACDIIDGHEEPITTHTEWEERYGGGGHSDEERDQVIGMDEDAARAITDTAARVIAAEALS